MCFPFKECVKQPVCIGQRFEVAPVTNYFCLFISSPVFHLLKCFEQIVLHRVLNRTSETSSAALNTVNDRCLFVDLTNNSVFLHRCNIRLNFKPRSCEELVTEVVDIKKKAAYQPPDPTWPHPKKHVMNLFNVIRAPVCSVCRLETPAP